MMDDIYHRLKKHVDADGCYLPAHKTIYNVPCPDVIDAMNEIENLRKQLSQKVTSAIFCEEPTVPDRQQSDE